LAELQISQLSMTKIGELLWYVMVTWTWFCWQNYNCK